jgi:hypothetical protein
VSDFREFDAVKVVSPLLPEILQGWTVGHPDDWKKVLPGVMGVIVDMSASLPMGEVIVEFNGPLIPTTSRFGIGSEGCR